eukprot:SAG25_NODE_425_length_8162_cov_5.814089_6_plen_39_part_00
MPAGTCRHLVLVVLPACLLPPARRRCLLDTVRALLPPL